MSGGDFILRPLWPAHPRVHAAQSLRAGGVSAGAFASLNIAAHVGDDPAAVIENRARLRRALALPAEPVWLDQVHGGDVLDADKGGSRTADAIVTGRAGVVCAIQTADCLPVLFADEAGTRVGAAHAGWRGLAAGVLEATVRALDRSAQSVIAWLGPAIGPDAFEVGAEVREAFMAHDAAAAGAFVANARGRWQADLFQLARRRLNSVGVTRIHGGGLCTFSDPVRFYSYRREHGCGRMATLIWLGS
jgi:YfiH family protein